MRYVPACLALLLLAGCVERPPMRPTPRPLPSSAASTTGSAGPSVAGDTGLCREYHQTVTIGDQSQEVYGTACRRTDGSWQVRGSTPGRAGSTPATGAYVSATSSSAPTGGSGTTQPPGTGDISFCREYHQKIMIGDQPQETYGTACRQPDGSWQVVR